MSNNLKFVVPKMDETFGTLLHEMVHLSNVIRGYLIVIRNNSIMKNSKKKLKE
jgi:hypothetical protein